MKTNLLFLCLLFSLSSLAQTTSLSTDLDEDGQKDKVVLKTEGEFNYKIVYSLSSQKGKSYESQVVTLGGQTNELSLKNKVVILTSTYMRGVNTFKFRYDKALKQLKVIGYDNEQFGNAVNDGSGTGSYNLSTGIVEATWNSYNEKKQTLITLPTIRKKLPVRNYTVSDFSDKLIEKLDAAVTNN